MSKTKATEAALFIGENEEILFLAFLGRLFRLCRWSFLLVWCRIELVCDEDDAVVLGALLINPLVWLEVALDGEQGSLLQLVEESTCSFLRHASMFMKADTLLVSSPFFS